MDGRGATKLLSCASLSESTLRRRRARPQASLTATHSSTLAEEAVALLRTLHSLGQWNGLINKYINSQLRSITRSCAAKPANGVGSSCSHLLVDSLQGVILT